MRLSQNKFHGVRSEKLAIFSEDIDLRIEQAIRDTEFDDMPQLRSAGIRLIYQARAGSLAGVKDGILLELGFDDTTPNRPVAISSWAWETATRAGVPVTDNRAQDVPCYAPTHTFVE